MVDKLCISRYARDYRTIAKAMFKHSDEHKLVTNSHLPGLRSRPVSPKELLLDLNTNSTQGLPTNSTDGYFQLHVTEIYEFPNETYVERQSCNSGRNILQLNDSTVCSLRSPDLRKGQRLIFYYMGRPVESEDDFLNKKIMPFTHFKFNNNHDYNNDNTTGGVKFELPIYQYISYKEAKAPLNATSLFATTFRHYTQYYIVLEICTHHKGVLTCKPVDHIKTKTLPSPTADYIYDNAMYETVNGTNATINWSEPLEPNGAVISYDIQYFKSTEFTDKAKAEYGDKICLNQWQYLLNSNSFTMTGLDPGTNYSYRVRANSIHGTGNWTTIHTFTVPGENWTTINYIINFARFIKHGII
ncbi:unnamed protein product [Oppiella nova]|uniref:Fibronectin type-III domain-containing protein n=1 Tax=Oppiella nova TaxID=334625 RepID=A0A7R9QWB0_9ACAR|nr:unnamed protein product [Oppiella nova]CAG2177992.1 unnamed protein product [Oppiella nova]